VTIKYEILKLYLMDISVLMSVYNNENTVGKAIDSILTQNFKNFEFLINDDCSTDATLNIIDSYAKKDNRVKIFKNKENHGLTKSLNYLITQASGSFIARQDGDDISFMNRLTHQINFIKNENIDACSSRAIIKKSKRIIPNYSYYLPPKLVIKAKNPFVHGTIMIKKSVLMKLGGYNEKFYYAQDYKLMKDLIENNYKVKIIKKPLYELNMENNISSFHREEQEYYAKCVRKDITPA